MLWQDVSEKCLQERKCKQKVENVNQDSSQETEMRIGKHSLQNIKVSPAQELAKYSLKHFSSVKAQRSDTPYGAWTHPV